MVEELKRKGIYVSQKIEPRITTDPSLRSTKIGVSKCPIQCRMGTIRFKVSVDKQNKWIKNKIKKYQKLSLQKYNVQDRFS